MNDINAPHSFRRLLKAPDGKHEKYVLSESRYSGLIDFLGSHLEKNPYYNAADIGCGSGVISRGLATKFKHVISIDGNPDNIALAESLTKKIGLSNISYKHGIATRLPIETKSMDLVIMNGVLEWVGANGKGEKPKSLQIQALRETLRILKPNGMLYLAIENRWHPRTILRDPHTHLPLVNALPRYLANKISNKIAGSDFQAYIYGFSGLRKMILSSGFSEVQIFTPFPGYQYPVFYIAIHPRRASLLDISAIDAEKVRTILRDAYRLKDVDKAIKRMHRRAKWGLLRLLTHDFVCLAKKQ